jgi:hypothetical protein
MQIVSKFSARFLDDTAVELPETDHHTVCKFEQDISPAFDIVMGGLCDMREDLVREAARILAVPANVAIPPS